jgi:hypothetical protein
VRPEQLKLAVAEEQERSEQARAQRVSMDELDEQIRLAMARWETRLGGVDAHKEMAELLSDDSQHPVCLTQVFDWLARRNGRRPPADLVRILCREDEPFNAWWNESGGYEAPKRKVALPPDEQIRRLRAALLQFGSAGEEKLRQVLAAPVPREQQEWEKPQPPPGKGKP